MRQIRVIYYNLFKKEFVQKIEAKIEEKSMQAFIMAWEINAKNLIGLRKNSKKMSERDDNEEISDSTRSLVRNVEHEVKFSSEWWKTGVMKRIAFIE